jgi:hypothetical protein
MHNLQNNYLGNAIKFIRGYIALQGPSIEAAASRAIDKVPQDFIQSQIKRYKRKKK